MKRILRSTLSVLALTNLYASNDLKLGIIGLDTSHAVAFTKILNDRDNPHHVKGAKVVAAFKSANSGKIFPRVRWCLILFVEMWHAWASL